MNKRATVFLYICLVGFVIAIVLFYGEYSKTKSGGETMFVGENALSVYQTYQEGEEFVFYINRAAELSAQQSSKETFEDDFEAMFSSYLENVGLTLEDFTIRYERNGDTSVKVVGIAKKSQTFEKKWHQYSVTPKFVVEKTFDESAEGLFV